MYKSQKYTMRQNETIANLRDVLEAREKYVDAARALLADCPELRYIIRDARQARTDERRHARMTGDEEVID